MITFYGSVNDDATKVVLPVNEPISAGGANNVVTVWQVFPIVMRECPPHNFMAVCKTREVQIPSQ